MSGENEITEADTSPAEAGTSEQSETEAGTSATFSLLPMPLSPPSTFIAVGGCSVSSWETASEARPFALVSRYFPRSMKEMSIALVSKHALFLPTAPPEWMESSVKKSE